MKMKSYLLQWQICKFLNSRVKFVISFEGDDDKMKKVATNKNRDFLLSYHTQLIKFISTLIPTHQINNMCQLIRIQCETHKIYPLNLPRGEKSHLHFDYFLI